MSDSIQAEYDCLKALSDGPDVSEHFRHFSTLFADQQLWKSYVWLLDIAAKPLDGSTVVDIGCKYGHLMPLLIAKGAHSTIGVDVDHLYLQPAKDVIAANWPQASFVKSERGFLPIKSDSADLVIVNEVISHVNPGYLPTMFSEVGRVLRVGGRVVISDGNNIANDACRHDLVDVYDAWENGPEGRKTGRDVVEGSFLELRKQRIRAWYPNLSDDKVDYLALNTSGLFGDYLKTVIDRYVSGGEFVERRYRRGDCPTNPGDDGVVMEYGFHPQQVEMLLAMYGIRAHQVEFAPRVDWSGAKRSLGTAYLVASYWLRKILRPGAYRSANWGFQILGVKER